MTFELVGGPQAKKFKDAKLPVSPTDVSTVSGLLKPSGGEAKQ